jgi:hypothetical protein
LAGLSFCLFVESGHGLYAPGLELEVIASVVMGGTMLTGGAGYVFGTLFGVLVLAVTQVLIQFTGSLSSWWTKIVIGILTLIFIGVQTVLANRKSGPQNATASPAAMAVRRKRQRLALGLGAIGMLAVVGLFTSSRLGWLSSAETPEAARCVIKPFREAEAANLIKDGAVIVYNRTAGPLCVDELFAVYPDGRVVGNDGIRTVEKQVDPAEVEQTLARITGEYKWFTDAIYGRYLTPCRQCFAHNVSISYQGQEKTVSQGDGTASMPLGYTLTLAEIRALLPEMNPAP